MSELFEGTFKGKKVLVTGQTGFKGSWIALWLQQLGAEVEGYSLSSPTDPSHFEILNLDFLCHEGDIRDKELLQNVVKKVRPDIVFHLAAQPLVRLSYQTPVETFETNFIGTLNLYEACRHAGGVSAIVSITSDKVYRNHEWVWGYRETDELGGKDPYSSSKAAVELMTRSYAYSYFHPEKYGKDHETLLATCRAGNVIGGGDWALDRLIPDVVKAAQKQESVMVRNPHATRPWQHVLEPLSGYLQVGSELLKKNVQASDVWNFGPVFSGDIPVGEVVKELTQLWPKISFKIAEEKAPSFHEATFLRLDCTKAHNLLSWEPVWDINQTLEKTIFWYQKYYEENKVTSLEDLRTYVEDAKKKNVKWAVGEK